MSGISPFDFTEPQAKAIADKLIVIVNNDHQRELKGSKAFQGEDERVIIISNLKAVDEVVLSIDQDRTVCDTIRHISEKFGILHDMLPEFTTHQSI